MLTRIMVDERRARIQFDRTGRLLRLLGFLRWHHRKHGRPAIHSSSQKGVNYLIARIEPTSTIARVIGTIVISAENRLVHPARIVMVDRVPQYVSVPIPALRCLGISTCRLRIDCIKPAIRTGIISLIRIIEASMVPQSRLNVPVVCVFGHGAIL